MLNGAIANQRHVEARAGPLPVLMLGQHRAGCFKQPCLLAGRYGISRLRYGLPGFNLHEYQRVPVGHDKVEFSDAGAQTLAQNAEALGLPQLGHIILGIPAKRLGGAELGRR